MGAPAERLSPPEPTQPTGDRPTRGKMYGKVYGLLLPTPLWDGYHAGTVCSLERTCA
jgi:hypothetical protein